jgi:hypothetical protein
VCQGHGHNLIGSSLVEGMIFTLFKMNQTAISIYHLLANSGSVLQLL